MTCVAMAALFLAVATLLPAGGVLFTPFLLGLFLLALVGVFTRHSDRRVSRQDPTLDAKSWRGRA